MKYGVVIMDGAAGWPLPEMGNRTCLELAGKPNLDLMAREGIVGLVRTVPDGMEPSSAVACMSVLGYDPKVYYRGRSGIEARSLGIPLRDGDVTFRCNLVTVDDGRMLSYSCGDIKDVDSHPLIAAVQARLGSDHIRFYPGVGYRHILVVGDGKGLLGAECTPPHDIPGKPIKDYLPKGPGSGLLCDLMLRSQDVLRDHPVNRARRRRGELPASMIWLFWPSGEIPELTPFQRRFGLKAAMSSAVDLLRGLARMTGIKVLEIKGVTAGLDNDYAAQATGALAALSDHDMVIVHIEAPDEAGHTGRIGDKIAAIESIDREVIGRFREFAKKDWRLLVMPDHPTPIAIRTHCPDPVPFLAWGDGFGATGAGSFTEAEGRRSQIYIQDGHTLMDRFVGVWQ
ncbi:MAG: cofactor-independent phosphoglycerate mutase [Dehalococcoidia bacterium]|nr:cofactor-independent phosphoglycerate mutase [Dehalococcoidia bacterium]